MIQVNRPGARLWETRWVSDLSRVLTLDLNGETVRVAVAPQDTLLEVLRDRMDLVGAKQGCDKGDCGACAVQLDGQSVLSCLTLAVQAEGRSVRTVEGLMGAELHPLVDAFDAHNASQCGFCTPGMLMVAEAALRNAERPLSSQEAAEALSGNLCRCTGYTKILTAVVEASEAMCASDQDSGEHLPPPVVIDGASDER